MRLGSSLYFHPARRIPRARACPRRHANRTMGRRSIFARPRTNHLSGRVSDLTLSNRMSNAKQSERIKPPALKKGDTVGIVAPASYFPREDFEAGCESLRQMGNNPDFCDSIFDRDLYFAGSVERRARELAKMIERPDVKSIGCARGGYGANYLLPSLDVSNVSADPQH